MRLSRALAFTAIVTSGCEASDPTPTPLPTSDTGSVVVDTGSVDSAVPDAGGSDASKPDVAVETAVDPCTVPEVVDGSLNGATCVRATDDYFAGRKSDPWPACISDDDAYHQLGASVSTIARIVAFEKIATLLGFGGTKTPSAMDFLDARLAYVESEGLESRVSRREDEHYPAAAKACRDMTPAEVSANADRCVGPAKIQPILNAAFADGSAGKEPVLNAARIEGALLWFLYTSVYKEAITCTTTPADCDSSWAYYTGGEPRASAKGFARYTKERSTQAHDRTFDAVLAVRCWRDLDNPTGAASNLAMRNRAVAQLDRALLRDLAVMVLRRLPRRTCGATWASTRLVAQGLVREAKARDAKMGAVIEAEVAKTDASMVDEKALREAIESLFPCP